MSDTHGTAADVDRAVGRGPADVVRLERAAQSGPDAAIRILTLDRPERLNAMDVALIDGLHDRIEELRHDDTARVVIVTGAGRGFCSGLDLQDLAPTAGASEEGRGAVQRGMDLQQRIAGLVPGLRSLRIPVIAAVNGPAAGGGLALALACDVRIAATSARFNVAFVRIGLSGCDIGVSWLLPRWIGASRAFELMLTGRIVESDEAGRIGLVSRVVPDADLLVEAMSTARSICANSPTGVWMTKEVMWSQLEVG
ncbi:MAG: enoyl-CoA hydratase/isomerase family protein, partial [Actinobacteria bacterium]|nr:enoyl-CoA hydratase/isomerase family protein [Actinomycetota bacterium]